VIVYKFGMVPSGVMVQARLYRVPALPWASKFSPPTFACSTCTGDLGGNGTVKVWGAVVSGGGDTGFAGTTDVRYSCDGIEVANGALGSSFNVASWTEVD